MRSSADGTGLSAQRRARRDERVDERAGTAGAPRARPACRAWRRTACRRPVGAGEARSDSSTASHVKPAHGESVSSPSGMDQNALALALAPMASLASGWNTTRPLSEPPGTSRSSSGRSAPPRRSSPARRAGGRTPRGRDPGAPLDQLAVHVEAELEEADRKTEVLLGELAVDEARVAADGERPRVRVLPTGGAGRRQLVRGRERRGAAAARAASRGGGARRARRRARRGAAPLPPGEATRSTCGPSGRTATRTRPRRRARRTARA